MATTVGTENDMSKLIEDFAYLERDAIAAYDEAISRLDNTLSTRPRSPSSARTTCAT